MKKRCYHCWVEKKRKFYPPHDPKKYHFKSCNSPYFIYGGLEKDWRCRKCNKRKSEVLIGGEREHDKKIK